MVNNSQPQDDKGLIAWFLGNHVAANILMMILVVGGIISVNSMRTETFPSIDPKLITVSVAYPGATPYEVADSITRRVEDSLTGIEGVKRITAKASEGFGIISVELEDFIDSNDVYNDVDTAVNGLSDFPPKDAERPIIQKIKATPNVITLAIHGDVSQGAIKYWAEKIEDQLNVIKGIANISLRGVLDHQISIEVSEDNLQNYNLTLVDISNAIKQFSIDVPAGVIESTKGDILLRVQEKRYVRSDFEKIIIHANNDGSFLKLGDVATIIDGYEDQNIESRFNGARSAFLDISRSETGDALIISQDIKDYLNTVSLPKGLTLSIQQDETVMLNDRISLMLRNAVIGFMLVFLILLLFLDLKLAFWTSVAVPVSFLGGLMVMDFFGYSINMVSVFALIVVLGVVVDDAIIVGESIFEAQKKDPNNPNVTLNAVKSVLAPVTVGVLTTVAAFAPLLFSTGTLGQIIGVIPAVVIPILLISLLEVYFILPAHLSSPNRWSKGFLLTVRNKFSSALEEFTNNIVEPAVKFAMTFRYIALSLFIGFAIITFTMLSSGIIRFVFFPDIEGDKVEIKIEMPVGTPYSITKFTINNIENIISKIKTDLSQNEDVIKSITTNIGEISAVGGGHRAIGNRPDRANNKGQIQIQLFPSDYRSLSSADLENIIRSKIDHLPNIETIEFQSSLIGGQSDIEIELQHDNEQDLDSATKDLKDALQNISGTKNLKDNFNIGKTEYIFELTDEGIAVGLTPAKLGQELRGAFFGIEAQRIQRSKSEVIVYVRYPKIERESLKSLQNMRIRLDNGNIVPLHSVARIRQQTGYASISTVNGQSVVTISVDADVSIITADKLLAKLQKDVLPKLQQHYNGLSYSFEGESREQKDDMASLGQNMLIALLLIYVLLGGILRSYIQPLVIMSAIPFGIVGALWGHYLLGYDLSFISFFGMVALSGVVVNDSVVLVDFLNKEKASGKSSFDAALSAVRRRFRPILLTTLTTSIGLLPILLERSIQAQFLAPMVVSLATGIIFATIVIMLLVPCLILVIDDIKSIKIKIPFIS